MLKKFNEWSNINEGKKKYKKHVVIDDGTTIYVVDRDYDLEDEIENNDAEVLASFDKFEDAEEYADQEQDKKWD